MVVQVLKVFTEIDNIETIEFPNDHEWCFDVEICGSGDVREKVLVCRDEEVDVPNSRGTANLVLKVDKNSYASITIIQIPKLTNGVVTASDAETSRLTPLIAFDCRGCEIKTWHPTGYYKVTTPAGSVFSEVDLQSGEWYEVESETHLPVSIMSFKHEFEVYRSK